MVPECRPNPCVQDNFVQFRGGCYELDKSGPCATELANVVGVNEKTLELICTKDNAYDYSSGVRITTNETPTCVFGGRRWTENKCPEQNK